MALFPAIYTRFSRFFFQDFLLLIVLTTFFNNLGCMAC